MFNSFWAFILINLQYNGRIRFGMALAWYKNTDLFAVH